MHTWKTPTPSLHGENAFFHNERSFECACRRNSSEQESCIRVAHGLYRSECHLAAFYFISSYLCVCVWFTWHECSTNIRSLRDTMSQNEKKTAAHQMVSVVYTVFLLVTFFAVIRLSTLLLFIRASADLFHWDAARPLCIYYVHGAVSAIFDVGSVLSPSTIPRVLRPDRKYRICYFKCWLTPFLLNGYMKLW